MWNIINELPGIFAILQSHSFEQECNTKAFILEMQIKMGWKKNTCRRWLPDLQEMGFIKLKGPNVVRMCNMKDGVLIRGNFVKGQVKL